MTTFSKWDIVLVPFPFTDLSSTKKRPALVVSPDAYNAGEDLVLAFLTSNLGNPKQVGDLELTYWKESGLPLPTKLRMKFATVSQAIILKRLGEISQQERSRISKQLLSFFR